MVLSMAEVWDFTHRFIREIYLHLKFKLKSLKLLTTEGSAKIKFSSFSFLEDHTTNINSEVLGLLKQATHKLTALGEELLGKNSQSTGPLSHMKEHKKVLWK